jgi:hypothetical protein
MQENARKWWKMQENAGKCKKMIENDRPFQKMLIKCSKISENTML